MPISTTFHPGVEIIFDHFKGLSTTQQAQFEQLGTIYQEWNAKLNLISRKDFPNLYLKHVLHALSIAKLIPFKSGTKVLDVGTGGGFPGIPLAIFFPQVHFHLVDSMAKKIHAVQAIAETLELKNVTMQIVRVENLAQQYDFILGRAVTNLEVFYNWVKDKIAVTSINTIPNGILYLKGDETAQLKQSYRIYPLNQYFDDPFFETKQLIHIPQIQYSNKKFVDTLKKA
ncbi:MAG: 16S rRNA (guanine(527)-N(7))-methyltransferase RsmG [Candidatus Amoebophilus sp. 36-38]|nr:MAG: 16S rRNA (guanine(527)-N(7))-methyltransferase RsmG [Candidatus Amoebophilus sp. 36-38]